VKEDVFGSWRPYYRPWINVGWFNSWAYHDGPVEPFEHYTRLYPGDVLQVNWTGRSTPNLSFFVDARRNGMELLAGHSNARWNLPFSYVQTRDPHARYWAIHVIGATRY
jgi:Putative amidase domain